MDRPSKIAFVDTETTGLSHLSRLWEIAVILRETDPIDVLNLSEVGPRTIPGKVADTEHLFQVEYDWHDLPDGTDKDALWIGGWKDRGRRGAQSAQDYREGLIGQGVLTAAGAEWSIAASLNKLLGGATLVGIGTHYDAEVLGRMFLRHGLPWQPWHYGIIDLKTAGWGYLRGQIAAGLEEGHRSGHDDDYDHVPVKSELMADYLGVEPPTDEDRHTALGDARWARRWFDAL